MSLRGAVARVADAGRALERLFLSRYDREDLRQYWRLRLILYAAISICAAIGLGALIAADVLPLPRLALVPIPLSGLVVLLLLRAGARPWLAVDVLLALFFSYLAALYSSGISAPIVMWLLVFPLVAVLLRGPAGGARWTLLTAGYFGWLFAFRWAPPGLGDMPDIFRHSYPASIPISFLTLACFFALGAFADGAFAAAMGKIEARNRELREEVARRRAAEEALAADLARRDRLISVMSHDLVNPTWGLSQLLASLHAAGEGLSGAELLEVKLGVDRIWLMLENLLYWSRGKSGGIAAEPRPGDYAGLLEEELCFLRDQAAAKGLTLEAACPTGGPALLADGRILRVVARNLVQNAVKFSPPGARIDVELLDLGGAAGLRVSDRGPGLPEGLLSRLDRMDSGRGTAGERGHGIGLALCLELCRASGGSLEASPRPGGGTVFLAILAPAGRPGREAASLINLDQGAAAGS